MREFNLLQDLPQSTEPRIATNRKIKSRIIASERGKEYYDGARENGYGGYINDGRWAPVAQRIISEYNLSNQASILHIGCDKGFLLEELQQIYPDVYLRGLELSYYAWQESKVRNLMRLGTFYSLPFRDKQFNCVIASGIYSLNLAQVMDSLKEIERVCDGNSHITLGAFETEEEEKLFRRWTLLGTTILSKNDWLEVLEHVGYTGDYWFNTASSLNLIPLNEGRRLKEEIPYGGY